MFIWQEVFSRAKFIINNVPKKGLGGKTHDEVFLVNMGSGPMDDVFLVKEEWRIIPQPMGPSDIVQAVNRLDEEMKNTHRYIIDIQAKQTRVRQKEEPKMWARKYSLCHRQLGIGRQEHPASE